MQIIIRKEDEPKFDGGPRLWKATVLWDADLTLVGYGEDLSSALVKLASKVKESENAERLSPTGRDVGWE